MSLSALEGPACSTSYFCHSASTEAGASLSGAGPNQPRTASIETAMPRSARRSACIYPKAILLALSALGKGDHNLRCGQGRCRVNNSADNVRNLQLLCYRLLLIWFVDKVGRVREVAWRSFDIVWIQSHLYSMSLSGKHAKLNHQPKSAMPISTSSPGTPQRRFDSSLP